MIVVHSVLIPSLDTILRILSSLGGLIAIGIAVYNGIKEDHREKRDREDRRKESTERLLNEKVEQYCLASRNLLTKCKDFGDAVEHGKDDLLMKMKQLIGEQNNIILLLEDFHLSFLKGKIKVTSQITSKLISYINGLVYRIGDRKGPDLTQALAEGKISDLYGEIEIMIMQNEREVQSQVEALPNLNLYAIFEEWQQKSHPPNEGRPVADIRGFLVDKGKRHE